MPARTFNLHDDFHIYLMWPLRMLQTGSLGGNPFDHIGVSSLGGQSFMQGMFLSFGEIADINAFDAILCLILLLGLLKELGELIGVSPVFAFAAGLLAIFINPHYANISSLYSASLMLLGLVYTTVLLHKSYESPTSTGPILSAVPCALFYAALLTLKTTFVFVVPFFWGAGFVGALLLANNRKQVLVSYLSCAALTTLLLVPWISLYWDRYLQKFYSILNEMGYSEGAISSIEMTSNFLSTLLSTNEMFFGNTFRDYLSIIVLLFIASVATGWIVWKNKSRHDSILLVPFLAAFLGAIMTFVLQFNFGPPRLMVRYACPILIGAAPATSLIAGWLWSQKKNKLQVDSTFKKATLFVGLLLIGLQLGLLGIFRETFVDRVKRAYYHNTLLSFPLAKKDIYKQYNDYVLSEGARKWTLNIQKIVPAGETIFAWASRPLHFDFTRNPIYTINESGLEYNLLVMPLADGVDRMAEYFRQFGIRYIIWDYNNYGMKKPNEMGNLQNNLIEILQGLVLKGKVLLNGEGIIVFDIGHDK
jgi:hypothetical protein